MEFIFMPVWANVCVIAAIVGLIALVFGPKVAKVTNTIAIKPAAIYYAVSATFVVALGIALCILSGVQTTTGVLIAYGVIGGVGAFACLPACEEGLKYVLSVGAVVAIALMIATLGFANVGYAAIWVTSLALMLFIGSLLFPKEKK